MDKIIHIFFPNKILKCISFVGSDDILESLANKQNNTFCACLQYLDTRPIICKFKKRYHLKFSDIGQYTIRKVSHRSNCAMCKNNTIGYRYFGKTSTFPVTSNERFALKLKINNTNRDRLRKFQNKK